MKRWRTHPTEENFWGVVLAYAGVKFKTYSGLPFSYEIKKGRNGEYTKELWIDRREKSKSLAWSSIVLALGNINEEGVDRRKALGDIRGEPDAGVDGHRGVAVDEQLDIVAGRAGASHDVHVRPLQVALRRLDYLFCVDHS